MGSNRKPQALALRMQQSWGSMSWLMKRLKVVKVLGLRLRVPISPKP